MIHTQVENIHQLKFPSMHWKIKHSDTMGLTKWLCGTDVCNCRCALVTKENAELLATKVNVT